MTAYFILIISILLIIFLRFLEQRKINDPINNRLPFSPTFLLMIVFVILLLDIAYILQKIF